MKKSMLFSICGWLVIGWFAVQVGAIITAKVGHPNVAVAAFAIFTIPLVFACGLIWLIGTIAYHIQRQGARMATATAGVDRLTRPAPSVRPQPPARSTAILGISGTAEERKLRENVDVPAPVCAVCHGRGTVQAARAVGDPPVIVSCWRCRPDSYANDMRDLAK